VGRISAPAEAATPAATPASPTKTKPPPPRCRVGKAGPAKASTVASTPSGHRSHPPGSSPVSEWHSLTPFPQFCIYWCSRMNSTNGAGFGAVSAFATQCLVYHRYVVPEAYSTLWANIGTKATTGTPITVNIEHSLPLHCQ
jgi:hypothetical protein